jgi:hypothetical protein
MCLAHFSAGTVHLLVHGLTFCCVSIGQPPFAFQARGQINLYEQEQVNVNIDQRKHGYDLPDVWLSRSVQGDFRNNIKLSCSFTARDVDDSANGINGSCLETQSELTGFFV